MLPLYRGRAGVSTTTRFTPLDITRTLSALAGVALAAALFSAGPANAFRIDAADRYFEPDERAAISFSIDRRGDVALGAGASHAAARQALAAWSGIPGATVLFEEGGFVDDLSRSCPGPNKIIFNDPESILPPPAPDPDRPGDCRGTLALGITRTSTFEAKDVGDRNFSRTRCGFVVVADGWEDCANWTRCNLEEAITHELGHVLGLAHSSEIADEQDATLRDAAMYFRAHFDGRCAETGEDDANGIRFVYPDALPPTILSGTRLPSAFLQIPYETELTATGGSGAFTWELGRTNTTGLEISADGHVTGTPSNSGDRFLQVRATDALGQSHTKVFDLRIEIPLTVPPTSTATATTKPTETATPTSTSTPRPPRCAGDCDGDRRVSVDEIIQLVTIALGTADGSNCVAGDLDASGSITVDEIIIAVDRALNGC